jgi:aerobic carbon-monoxide dehydrogenase medium subunit
MKSPRFEYLAPRTLDEVLQLLADPNRDSVILAGGQSLMPMLNLRLVIPSLLIDINRVQGLDTIELSGDSVRIGAMARLATVEHHPLLKQTHPILSQGLLYVAHPQVRNRGTVGGTLCHADPTAEFPTMCLATEASFTLVSTEGRRTVPASEFFRSVLVTAKRSNEMLIEVALPTTSGVQYQFGEIARRNHGDFPYVASCVGLRLSGGTIEEARVAAGGVAEPPVRLPATEEALIGRELDEDLADVLAVACEEVSPPSDNHGSADFRRGLLCTLMRRAFASYDHGMVAA